MAERAHRGQSVVVEGTDGQSAETAASNDAAHELELFLQQDQAELAAEYRRIYARTSEDPGTAGDEGEGNWAQVLQKWLPKRYHVVTKGRVVFPDRSASAQIDVLVLRGSYPPRLLTKKLYLSTGVVAAFECKNTLTAAHVRAAVETAASLKDKVARRAGSLQQELRSPLVYGLLAHSHSWKGEESTPIDNVDEALQESVAATSHPSQLIDIICVADLAAWTLGHFVECPWFFPPAQRTLRARVGVPPEGWVLSQFTRFADGVFAEDVRKPNPIAILVSHLLEWCAWDDVDLRPIADYFRLAGLQGSGTGPGVSNSLDAFSDGVRAQLKVKPPTTGRSSAWGPLVDGAVVR